MTGFRPTALLHVRGHTNAPSIGSSIYAALLATFPQYFLSLRPLLAKFLKPRARRGILIFAGLLETAERRV